MHGTIIALHAFLSLEGRSPLGERPVALLAAACMENFGMAMMGTCREPEHFWLHTGTNLGGTAPRSYLLSFGKRVNSEMTRDAVRILASGISQ